VATRGTTEHIAFSQNSQNLQSQLLPYHAPQSYPTQTGTPTVPQALSPTPPHAQYQPPHRRNDDNELRTKVTNLEQSVANLEQHMGKMNSILESLVISQQTQGRFPAQPQQNPKPANYIDETHEQVHAITTLRSGKEIDKTIAPKEVNYGKNGESGELSQESESEKKKIEEKDH